MAKMLMKICLRNFIISDTDNWDSHTHLHPAVFRDHALITGPMLCISSPVSMLALSDMLTLCLLCVYAARLCTPTGRHAIYHWHDTVQSQAPTNLRSEGALTCVKHLTTPKLGANWCTGHSHWDWSQLDVFGLKPLPTGIINNVVFWKSRNRKMFTMYLGTIVGSDFITK